MGGDDDDATTTVRRGYVPRGTLSWVTGHVRRGLRGRLRAEDMPPLEGRFDARDTARRAFAEWDARIAHDPEPSVLRLLWRMERGRVVGGVAVGVAQGVLSACVRPLLLNRLISAYADEDHPVRDVVALLTAFALTVLLEGFAKVVSINVIATEGGTSMLSWLIPLVHRKATRLRRTTTTTTTTTDGEETVKNNKGGEDVDTVSLSSGGGGKTTDPVASTTENEVTLVGKDILQVFEDIKFSAMGPQGVAGLISGIVTLVFLLGSSSLVGFATMFVALVLNFCFTRISRGITKRDLAAADRRLSVMREVVLSIAPVKYACWEDKYLELLDERRNEECGWLLRFRFVLIASISLGRISPILTSAFTFAYMGWRGLPLEPSVVFAALAAFNALRLPLIIIPIFTTQMATLGVSMGRITDYLLSPEYERPPSTADADDDDVVVECRDADLSWGGPSLVLRDVDLVVPRGRLVAVVGAVGSGKTTLLSGLVGESCLAAGSVRVVSDLGLVPQRAFVLSGTIRDNVLMGRPLDVDRLDAAVAAAALTRDLAAASKGLDTEVGEGGTTLSGGQRQRLAIARAVYADPELLLMDDALAAVDGRVAAHVWEHVLEDRRRRGRTTVCALNQTAYLPRFDAVLYLRKDGSVAQGTYDELKESDPDFAAFACVDVAGRETSVDALVVAEDEDDGEETVAKQNTSHEDATTTTTTTTNDAPDDSDSDSDSAARLVEDDTQHSGAVSSQTLRYYFHLAGGPLWLVFVLTIGVAAYGLMATTDLWLAAWVSPRNDRSVAYRATVYVVLSLAQSAAVMLLSVTNACATNRASRNLHHDAVARLLRAPVSWYERTPSGRILSRFSGDLGVVDKVMSYMVDDVVQFSLLVLAIMVTIVYVVHEIAPILIVGIFVYGFTIVAVDRTNRQAKRETNLALSPVMTTMSETISGSALIHAMGFEEFFCQRQLRNVNAYNKYNHFSCTTVQFVSIVTNFLAFIFSISTAVLVYVKRDTFPDITYIGVALNYSFLVPYFLIMLSIVATYLATTATCLERILDFVVGDHAVPQEPPWTLPTDPDPDTWPAKGDLEFENVCLRYRPGLPLALDDVSFRAEHGENVGVVGRTGAGKSSLVASLFRIVDAESGVIRLDGVDLRRVGAHAARRAVAVVPQTPLLIPGTVGHNLDPFGVETRERMEAALRRVGLDDPDALDARADRLSAGERQLLALARLLLRDGKGGRARAPRVVVLDEPTANVDARTDDRVQRVVREEFGDGDDVTMLTIAHRLRTVVRSDKMLVMSNGAVAEFDRPATLLADENGVLSDMVRASGEPAATELRNAAAAAAATSTVAR